RRRSSPGISAGSCCVPAKPDLFVVHGRVAEGGGLDEEHEDIEVLEIPLDEAAAMIETGEILEVKTIVLLQWALLNRAKLTA
ncbi:hypothetical protein ACC754_40670, partial [Rhizobium johnstonii]